MTFDDDFVLIDGKMCTCESLKIEWPPPRILVINEFAYRRQTRSLITDRQRSRMTHIARGAQYQLIGPFVDPNDTNH